MAPKNSKSNTKRTKQKWHNHGERKKEGRREKKRDMHRKTERSAVIVSRKICV